MRPESFAFVNTNVKKKVQREEIGWVGSFLGLWQTKLKNFSTLKKRWWQLQWWLYYSKMFSNGNDLNLNVGEYLLGLKLKCSISSSFCFLFNWLKEAILHSWHFLFRFHSKGCCSTRPARLSNFLLSKHVKFVICKLNFGTKIQILKEIRRYGNFGAKIQILIELTKYDNFSAKIQNLHDFSYKYCIIFSAKNQKWKVSRKISFGGKIQISK